MDLFDTIIATLAFFVSLWALKQSKNAISLTISSEMTTMRQLIESRKEAIVNAVEAMSLLVAKKQNNSISEEEKQQLAILLNLLETKKESLLNCYEEVCEKYIGGKIDKKHFKKQYKVEIRNLISDKDFSQYFREVSSPYQRIITVYRELEDIS